MVRLSIIIYQKFLARHLFLYFFLSYLSYLFFLVIEKTSANRLYKLFSIYTYIFSRHHYKYIYYFIQTLHLQQNLQ